MKTKDLIDQLSKNPHPVKPLPGIRKRMFSLLGSMILGSGIIFAFSSKRPDLHEALFRSQFFIGALVLLVSWVALTYSVSILQLPTIENKKYLSIGGAFVFVLALGYLIKGMTSAQPLTDGFSSAGLICSLHILLLSAIPFILLFLTLRKSAPVQSLYAGLNIGLCCATLGIFLLQFSCPNDNPSHLLMWHVLVPIGSLGVLGALLGQKILKW
jgi:hypothetical protein